MDARDTKDSLFETVATAARALASPRRLELLDLLAQRSHTVEELAGASGQSSANASQHLQALRAAGLVSRRREGTSVRYALAGDDVIELLSTLQTVSARRIAEFERAASAYLGEPVEAIVPSELDPRVGAGSDMVIVDVRPEEEFRAGHIEGAISIPIDQLPDRLAELPEEAEIIAYCRGPLCAYAHEAVRQLHQAGREARRLEGGWTEWRLAHANQETAGQGARSATVGG